MEGDLVFKVDDIVMIRSDSQFYNTSYRNPAGIAGKIFNYPRSVVERYRYVFWENGEYNVYEDEDLELVLPNVVDQEVFKMLYPGLFKEVDYEKLVGG